jgi:hypothetical protein
MSAVTCEELSTAALQAHQASCALSLVINATGSQAEREDACGLVKDAIERLSEELYELAQREEPAGARRGGVFTDDSPERAPLKDFPPALPCGFCLSVDDLHIVQEKPAYFHVSCGHCGADAGFAETALDAANRWNQRGQVDDEEGHRHE